MVHKEKKEAGQGQEVRKSEVLFWRGMCKVQGHGKWHWGHEAGIRSHLCSACHTHTYSAGGGEPLKGVGREFSLERSLGLLIENGLSCEDCKQGDYFPKS